ncbi:hypothetical protein [Photobacterium leiognathi]|uniref:hypothetical protein n=1 Tax=Photobacterium leiognathi TaxID=553611 RepID=UPI002981A851|nr:hypothetical protein [Photobacterium leiognathi]
MSLHLKRIIHLKAAQKKIEMLKSWNELSKVKERNTEISEHLFLLDEQYSSLNDESIDFRSAELNELALEQANYLAISINNISEELNFLKDKEKKIDNDVITASALSDAYEKIEEEVHDDIIESKNRSTFEMELTEAVERTNTYERWL